MALLAAPTYICKADVIFIATEATLVSVIECPE